MDKTPKAFRKHIGIYGDANSGKSSLFNSILNQELAIVSDKKGTTTDPVVKAMELIPFGPITLVDTAGFNDNTEIGDLRTKKTAYMLRQTDLAIIAVDYKQYNMDNHRDLINKLKKFNVPYITVFTKADSLTDIDKEEIKKVFKNPFFVSVSDKGTIEELRQLLSKELTKHSDEGGGLLDGLIDKGKNIVLVIPIDSAAPKGRIMLPQVQLIRECLDRGVLCHISKETELRDLLRSIHSVDLVVTDSQAFKAVNEIVPKDIKLTSFSMLLARQKGDLKLFYDGLRAVDSLKDNDSVLIAESCTHNTSHEDIGRVKIPNMLRQKTKKDLKFEFCSGYEFPENIKKYSLIIHCGGCMITKKAMVSRIDIARAENVPITNYGVILAYMTGAADRQKFLITLNL